MALNNMPDDRAQKNVIFEVRPNFKKNIMAK